MSAQNWVEKSIFYHIYPLGLLGCPKTNNFSTRPKSTVENLTPWLKHIRDIGCNSIYFGPIFESTSHGYDTADYYQIDRRLGTNDSFRTLAEKAKKLNLKIVLDGVFNHVGRDFWAFKDLQANGKNSSYVDWFSNVSFKSKSPLNDAFSYDGWDGHYNLVKLNLSNQEVKEYLFGAIRQWVEMFGIDGLRLDAADSIDFKFFKELKEFCSGLSPDFWLMGEVVHGDYNNWVNSTMLDSTTNYECYKGLYSSHNDKNYFEIAYSLNRQFGSKGLYKNMLLYNFADNHDVNRVASRLKKSVHLYPLYGLLFTIPGIPSIYYGSEWGMEGEKRPHEDNPLRPHLTFQNLVSQVKHPDLLIAIKKFARIRQESSALQKGDYRQLFIDHEQFVFSRSFGKETILVAVNSSKISKSVRIPIPKELNHIYSDLLESEKILSSENGILKLEIPPNWLTILSPKK